jgi:hypothetical protein
VALRKTAAIVRTVTATAIVVMSDETAIAATTIEGGTVTATEMTTISISRSDANPPDSMLLPVDLAAGRSLYFAALVPSAA